VLLLALKIAFHLGDSGARALIAWEGGPAVPLT
jgi:hypothetical protein